MATVTESKNTKLVCGRGCNESWDVRCCCELDCKKKNTNKQFYNCPVKLQTIYFHLGNDYDLYNAVESDNWNFVKRHFKLTSSDILQLQEWKSEDN